MSCYEFTDEERKILLKNKLRRKYKRNISIDDIDELLAEDGWDELYE